MRCIRKRLLTASLLTTIIAGAKADAGVGPLEMLSGLTGTYTHIVDDDLAVTLSYDLQYDSFIPWSFLTGVSVTKVQELYREAEPTVPVARLTLSGSTLIKQRIPSGGASIETNNRSVGIQVNHGSRRAQFRFGRSFMDGRFRISLNPLLTYGEMQKRRVNFGTWVPAYRPLLSEAGMPRMSLQQRSVVWDWVQGMPQQSTLRGKGLSLRLHAGRGAWLSATLFDGAQRSRLWSVNAEVPLAKPSAVSFSVERTWQVATTERMRW